MTFPAIIVLACALAMDATAVAAARGLAAPRLRVRDALVVAVFFGGFQALMPLIGWFVGVRLGSVVDAWDHWVAFVLLGGIGARMVWEAIRSSPESPEETPPTEKKPFGFRIMLLLAIATSIDALAAGIALPLVDAPVVLSIATIGITTAILSAAGLYAGRHFGAVLGRRLDMVGGLVLIAIGTQIVIRHVSEG